MGLETQATMIHPARQHLLDATRRSSAGDSDLFARVQSAAHDADTSPFSRRHPTQAQLEANSYRTGRVDIQGLPLRRSAPISVLGLPEWNPVLQKRFSHRRSRYTNPTRHIRHSCAFFIELFCKIKVPLKGAMPFVFGGNSAPTKCHQYGLSIDAKRFRHFVKCCAVFSKLYCSFQAPFGRSDKQVVPDMFALHRDLKVVRVVIQPVLVFVVNDLFSCERATKHFFHYKPVFKALAANSIDHNANQPISSLVPRKNPNVSLCFSHGHAFV